ncbi:MAG: hypothetical protein FWE91_09650 [Defluviitaleaceae bacterium]|nr:hypothetical protein [Defluviitaleaceae bacterium]
MQEYHNGDVTELVFMTVPIDSMIKGFDSITEADIPSFKVIIILQYVHNNLHSGVAGTNRNERSVPNKAL